MIAALKLLFGLLQCAGLHEEAGENGAHVCVSSSRVIAWRAAMIAFVDATLSRQRVGEQIVEWHAVRMDVDGGAHFVLGTRQIGLTQLEGAQLGVKRL